MMDNIREKLVALLKHVSKKCQKQGGVTWYDFADHLIANGLTVQEWIPVTERLPKENGRYNVCVADRVHTYVDAVWFYKEGVGFLHENVWAKYDSEDGFYKVRGITHWMPMPTPPKGE